MKLIDLRIANAFRRMRAAHKSAREISFILGLSAAHIGKILSGKVNYFEDKTWERIEPIVSRYMAKEEPRTIEAITPSMTGIFVPIVSLAGAASIHPGLSPIMECVNEHAEESAYFPQAKDGDFVIQVSGTSMSPWYPDGTLLLVRPSYDIPNGKRVIAVLDNGDILFKVFARKDQKFCLFSIDNEGRDFVFERPHIPVRYICRVIASIRDEDALDTAMQNAGISHSWQAKLETL